MRGSSEAGVARALGECPDIEVVGEAENGEQAVELVAKLKPSVVTLDVEMPRMDGLTALPLIKRAASGEEAPAVVMVSSLTKRGSETAFRALARGAADVVAKDRSVGVDDVSAFGKELIRVILAVDPAARHRRRPLATRPQDRSRPAVPGAGSVTGVGGRQEPDLPPVPSARAITLLKGADPDLIVIGSSTGGPPVVERLVRALPATGRIPVVVAQHMPALFTRTLAERLDRVCPVRVALARHGEQLEAGVVYIAEGEIHTRIGRGSGLRFDVGAEPASAVYRPSCNELFASAAGRVGARTLGIVLTGMGEDGRDGALEIRRCGGTVLSQHASSCVVYGMPRAVEESGASVAAMLPEGIAEVLTHVCGGDRNASACPIRRSA